MNKTDRIAQVWQEFSKQEKNILSAYFVALSPLAKAYEESLALIRRLQKELDRPYKEKLGSLNESYAEEMRRIQHQRDKELEDIAQEGEDDDYRES